MKAPNTKGAATHDYSRELRIEASCDRAFEAIATIEGLRGWWTPLVTGSHAPRGTIRLEFEGMEEHIDIRVNVADRPSKVEWSILEHTSLDEWSGTKVHFQLSPEGTNACRLAFRHEGLSPKLECYDDCEAGWDHFLESLVGLAERGRGAPFRSRQKRA
jgi:uncharacterized protein YndB with AHSA1/START domain